MKLVLRAADLRATYEVRLPDTIQIAVSILSNATGFVTNDEKLRRVREVEEAQERLVTGGRR